MKSQFDSRVWLARLLIAIVTGWNLQAAAAFLASPERFAPAFELSGVPGEAAMRGMAVLFVMWNVPYLAALWNPRQHRLSAWEALAMQTLGVAGESIIYFSLPAEYPRLLSSIQRFVLFDAAGIVLLASALLLSRKTKKNKVE